MKRMPLRDVKAECEEIWNKFLGPGAEMLVNVDSKTRRTTEQNMKSADRWTFDDAAAHLYYLMTRDGRPAAVGVEFDDDLEVRTEIDT